MISTHLQVKLVNIRNDDIADGNPKLTLGLIWTIILHFQVTLLRTHLIVHDCKYVSEEVFWHKISVSNYLKYIYSHIAFCKKWTYWSPKGTAQSHFLIYTWCLSYAFLSALNCIASNSPIVWLTCILYSIERKISVVPCRGSVINFSLTWCWHSSYSTVQFCQQSFSNGFKWTFGSTLVLIQNYRCFSSPWVH